MSRPAGIVVLALALALPAAAGAAAPPKQKTTHTAAGMAAATRAVLATRDLGSGWTAGKAGPADESLSCGTTVLPSGVVETGKAVSPTFTRGAGGPFVAQAVFVYATPSQAKQVWQQTLGKVALSCLSDSVSGGSTKDIRFTVLRRQTLAAPGAGTRSAAYRVVARVHTTAQTIAAYVDLVLVSRGNALAEISYAAFQEPLDRTTEVAVARTLGRRL